MRTMLELSYGPLPKGATCCWLAGAPSISQGVAAAIVTVCAPQVFALLHFELLLEDLCNLSGGKWSILYL